jgi:hypothetical protein
MTLVAKDNFSFFRAFIGSARADSGLPEAAENREVKNIFKF